MTLDTSGKRLYDTPRNLLSAGVGYDNRTFYANFLGRHTGSFYGDLANKEKIGGYTVFDLNLGYRLNNLGGYLKNATLTLNLNNVFDKQYLSGVNSGSVSADPVDADFYDAPQYYKGAPRALVAGISIDI
ncbi:TonB-dependent receptor [Alcaligenaceae bacterium SAGV5]|nr:TonB-dependent receptor [Alcaligenaceae bacterium SAGV5]